MLGSHCAMSPGARTMPAAMVFPTAAAIPNHIPKTCKSRPRPRPADSVRICGASGELAGGASNVLDNGGLGGPSPIARMRRRHDKGGRGKCKLQVAAAGRAFSAGRKSLLEDGELSGAARELNEDA